MSISAKLEWEVQVLLVIWREMVERHWVKSVILLNVSNLYDTFVHVLNLADNLP